MLLSRMHALGVRWAAALIVVAVAAMARLAGAEDAAETAVERVSGTVFLDANRNGSQDAGEPPLVGVRVTDSVGFVVTDDQGRFTIEIADDVQIPYAPARVVSVSWPAGYWPTGRWWRRLSEIGPDGQVAFGLREDVQKTPFMFTQVGDCHGGAAPFVVGGPFQKLFAEQFGPLVKFCVHAGDYGYCSEEIMDSMFDTVAKNTRDFPVPMFFNIGNHDLAGRTAEAWQKPRNGYWGFTKHLGPVRWSFSYGGAHFAAVDWADISSGEYAEGAPAVAAAWLDADLAAQPEGTRSFVFLHHPSGTPEFVDVVVKHDVAYVFGGHVHKYKQYRVGGKVPGMTVLNANSVALAAVVVQDDRHDVVHYCGGCKHGPHYHSKKCALGRDTSDAPAWARLRKGSEKLADARVADGSRPVLSGDDDGVEIVLAMQPGTAKRSGLRLGRAKQVEVSFEGGDTLRVADTPIPFVPRAIDQGVNWHLAVVDGRLTILCNNLIRFTREVDVDEPAAVEVFAEGGDATFTAVEAWSLAGQAVATP